MKILALDIATLMGVAVGDDGEPPKCHAVDLGKGRSEDARFSKILSVSSALIAEHEPDLVAIEAAIGGKFSSAYLIGLVACVRGCAHNRGVPVELFQIPAIRKHFIGRHFIKRDFPGLSKGMATKEIKKLVIARCKLLGWGDLTDDEADAAALLDYARAKAGSQVSPAGGLFT